MARQDAELTCVSGRLLSVGEPAKDIKISLITTSVISGGPKSDQRSGEFEFGPKAIVYTDGSGHETIEATSADGGHLETKIRRTAQGVRTIRIARGTESDDEGRFSICVEPGSYKLEARTELGPYPLGSVLVVKGEPRELGDIEIMSDTRRRFYGGMHADLVESTGAVRVHTGHHGLDVRTTIEGERGSQHRATTDKGGDAWFKWEKPNPVRIDLVDTNGFILGSTDRFEVYPRNADVELFIPSVPGTLKIHLPSVAEAKGTDTYQIHLTRTDSPELDLRIKSIGAKRIPLAERGYRTSPNSLEYKRLRTGAYDVKAIRKVLAADKKTREDAGDWLHGTTHVFAGQVSHCTLE